VRVSWRRLETNETPQVPATLCQKGLVDVAKTIDEILSDRQDSHSQDPADNAGPEQEDKTDDRRGVVEREELGRENEEWEGEDQQ
jgi:hypothetical protein